MDLPNLFSSGSKVVTEEMVLFLILTDLHVKVLLLELSNEGVKIIDESKKLSYDGLDKCVHQTDVVLQHLGPESENVNEIVFAVNTSWVKDGVIIDEKKPIIKRLTEELNLQPLGFIDINEALAQQQILENALYSGTVVVVTQNETKLTLIYQGKIMKTEVVGSSGDFDSDFKEGIARIHALVQKHGNYVPQKVLLASFDLSSKEIKEKQQNIYEIDWKSNSQFLQPPTVDLLSDEDYILFLSRQAGKNAAVQKGLTKFAFAADVIKGDRAEKDIVSEQKKVENLDYEELGFSDPLKEKEIAVEIPTSFGIPIKSTEIDMKAISQADNLKEANLDFVDELERAVDSPLSIEKANKHKKFDITHHKNIKWFVILGLILGVLTLIAGFILSASVVAQTQVSITLNKKPVSKDVDLKLDTSIEETDAQNLTIAADTVQKTKSSTSTMQTTGIKIVGEKSKGRVSIYNKTNAVKKFEKGTLFKSGELLFSLDEDITVASASAKQGGEDYGRQDVNLTAEQIGAESNLAEKTEFSIGSYDTGTYNAYVIDDDFVGGSSREVRVVSAKDKTELLSDLKNEIIETINQEFKDESGNGTYILPSKSVVSQKEVYDAEVESEAEGLTLKLELTIEAVTYSGGDLKPVAEEILKNEIPENYILIDADPEILSSPSETDLDKLESGAVVSLEANISSYALPVLREEDIKTEILGKSFLEAESLLKQKEEIASVEFSVKPTVFGSFVKNISNKIEKITVTFVK